MKQKILDRIAELEKTGEQKSKEGQQLQHALGQINQELVSVNHRVDELKKLLFSLPADAPETTKE